MEIEAEACTLCEREGARISQNKRKPSQGLGKTLKGNIHSMWMNTKDGVYFVSSIVFFI